MTLPDLPDALCQSVDPELFYPETGKSPADAKRVCRRCDVQLECLRWALEHDERHGIWGGLGPGQRAHLQKRGNAA